MVYEILTGYKFEWSIGFSQKRNFTNAMLLIDDDNMQVDL